MPDAAKKWLEDNEKLAKMAPFQVVPPVEHLRCLLAENERLERELDTEGSMRWEAQSDYGNIMGKTEALEVDNEKLVAVLRILNEPIAYCAYPGFEKDDAYSRVERMREAVEALPEELQELIDDSV